MAPTALRSSVYAMARPRRPGSERVAVRAAAAQLGDSLSASRKAASVARQVVAAFLLHLDRTDALQVALHEARQRLDPDPVEAIVLATDSIVAAKFIEQRLRRYEARGCQQLTPSGWEDETRAIARLVQAQLTRRFRDYLR